MNIDGVGPGEMDAQHDLDDSAADALISGDGAGVDDRLADMVGDLSIAYASQPLTIGAELAALMTPDPSASAHTTKTIRRNRHMQAPLVIKLATAAASIFAATGGLAVAHALPAPMQDAASHLGIGAPAHQSEHAASSGARETAPSTTTPSSSTTTAPPASTPTSAEPSDSHAGPDSAARNADSVECSKRDGGAEAPDPTHAVDSTTVPATTDTTVPCVPSSDTTEPQASESHDGNGDSTDSGVNDAPDSTVPNSNDGNGDGADGNSSVSTVPNSNDGNGGTSVTTAPSSDNKGGDTSNGGSDGSNSGAATGQNTPQDN